MADNDLVDSGKTDEPATPDFLIRFHRDGQDADPLVTVKRDGTVIVHHDGADKEAARLFWNEMQVYGRTLLQHLEEAKEREAKLRADMRAEQEGMLDLRREYGAMENETFAAWIARLRRESAEAFAKWLEDPEYMTAETDGMQPTELYAVFRAALAAREG